MIKAIIGFIVERGFVLMLVGFCAAWAGVIAFMLINTPRYAATPYPTLAFALAIAGVAVYLAGRLSMWAKRRRARREPADDDADDTDSADDDGKQG